MLVLYGMHNSIQFGSVEEKNLLHKLCIMKYSYLIWYGLIYYYQYIIMYDYVFFRKLNCVEQYYDLVGMYDTAYMVG